MLLSAVIYMSIGWFLLVIFGLNNKVIFNIKWTVAYVVIWILKKRSEPTFGHKIRSKEININGIISTRDSWIHESPQQLTSNTNDADILGFWAVDNHGNAVIIRIARRHDRKAEVAIYLKLSNGEEYQLPIHPDVEIVNTDGKTFTAGGLTCELLEPLRRWRVSFNGLLRKSVDNTWSKDNEVLPVQFNFIWHPIYFYMAIPDDLNISLLATIVSKEKWTSQFLQNCSIFPENWYEQCGELQGTVIIDEKQELTLLLRGHKDRKHTIKNWSVPERGVSIKGYLKNGTAFHIYGEENSTFNNFVHGYVNLASNISVYSVSECSLNVKSILDELGQTKDVLLQFRADSDDYLLLAKDTDYGFTVYLGENWDQEVTTKLVNIKVNGKDGFGVIEYRRPYNEPRLLSMRTSVPMLVEPDIHETNKLIVHFTERVCQSSRVVGGKGASLGMLTYLTLSADENFVVPPGFCITNEAFHRHLKQNSKVTDAIESLEDIAWQRRNGSIQEECTKVMEAMLATDISIELKETLEDYLKNNFEKYLDDSFAVRSSAIGEDSEELSAAGQNETYLGVKGVAQISKAIVKCWASQFSFRSVEYKRQYGQLLNGGMGVVVQLMVPSDVAGVLFSRDPRTGSPAYMTITSNYGLGESVVAAAADPDTIILRRTWDDQLHIKCKEIGKKNLKIIMSDNGGTLESEINADESAKCTLSDELCIELGNLAIHLEQCFGNARDNEWAVHDGRIYLLQSRPVTSDSVLTDVEVVHEFETGFKTDHECYATANIQEVMPGALTPLTLTGTSRAMSVTFVKMQKGTFGFRYDPTIVEGVVQFQNHSMFDRIQQKCWGSSDDQKSGMTKALQLGFFGRVLDDNDACKIALERYDKPQLLLRLMMMSFSIIGITTGPWMMKKIEKKYRNHSIPMDGAKTPEAAYRLVNEHLMDVENVIKPHMSATMASTVWNLFVLNVLSQGSETFELDHYTDFASLIGSCNGTESGCVPFKLKELADAIASEINNEQFISMSPGDAMKRLEEENGSVLKKIQEFLKQHGHRGFKEFEMRTITWGMDPIRLIVVLQNLLKSSKAPAATLNKGNSIETAIREMKTPISKIQRKILAIILYFCRTFVCYREQAKSLMINCEHSIRKSYRHLAELMIKAGLIPDADLMYFFTHEEIGQLIETRSPRIIRRAKRRRHHYDYMDSLHFPEMIDGYPVPIEEMNHELINYEGLTQVKGFPACSGVIQGNARVICSFNEVETINRGDILITYATDIGWSPYFPLLSGVVTEIGGLISHGAVVAREYGLPCLIGAENATKIFKSGDIVKLDATKGLLLKIN